MLREAVSSIHAIINFQYAMPDLHFAAKPVSLE